MKNLKILILILSAFSCQGTKNLEEKPICPKGYECYAEILEGKSINASKDTIGQEYLRLKDSKNSMVFKYTYKYENKDPRIADAGYSEIIYFEIPSETKKMDLENFELSKVKLYIQKLCFCPDAGYEKILNGNLKLRNNKSSLTVDLNFETEKEVRLTTIQTEVQL